MATGMIEIMKVAALEAMENGKPCDIRTGKIVSTSPLKIKINDNLTLPASVLVVPEHLTDHTVKVSMNWTTSSVSNHTHTYDDGTTGGNGSHNHSLSSNGEKSITIHNALRVGDLVCLIRNQGGKTYYIIDRI